MDGVLVVDKPAGLTSHDVVASARRLFGERHIGHTGTLDPLATGVLPLALGRATRLVRFFTASDKDYDATILFGVTTDSYDTTGSETGRTGVTPPREAIERALDGLRGEYMQMPPAYSAKKVGGHRAYDLARRDQPVALQPAPVRVTRAELVDVTGPRARIAITCSAGFYVRTFAHMLGELAGPGACLEALRRTRSGDFTLATAVALDRLFRLQGEVTTGTAAEATSDGSGERPRPEGFVPLSRLLPSLPAVIANRRGREYVGHGRELGPGEILGTAAPAEWVRITDENGDLLAMGRPGSAPGVLHPSIVLM